MPQSRLAAAAGALCAALGGKDPAMAQSAAAALGHAGVRSPLPLPLRTPALAPGTPQAPAAQASAAGAAERAGAEAGGAARPTTAAAASGVAASGPGGAGALQTGNGSAEAGSQAERKG